MLRYMYLELLLLWSNMPIVGQSEIRCIASYKLEMKDEAAFKATFSLYHTAILTICR